MEGQGRGADAVTLLTETQDIKSFVARRVWLDEEQLRLDASTYAAGALLARDQIVAGPRPWRRLDEVARLFNGPRFARRYVRERERGVPFLSSSDILLADLGSIPLLSKAATPGLDRLLVEGGWTLISCSGTIGNTAYVRPEMHGMAASQHVMRAVPDESKIAPGYLFAFLTARHGQVLLRRRTYGSLIQHIEPQHIADLPVPLPDPGTQDRIHNLVAGAAIARTEASRLLDEAAAYFDGLAGPMPSAHDHARAVGVLRSPGLHLRLDAFHHVGWAAEPVFPNRDRIDDLAEVIGTNRVPRAYAARGVPFLSGIDVFKLRPGVRVRLAAYIADAYEARVMRGDLAVQGSGQRYGLVGQAAYLGRRLDGWAASHDLFRIRASDPSITARIFAFLRSDSGHRVMLRHSYGTSIPHVNPVGIAGVEVPPLPAELLTKVSRAIELREQADEDEERAIREVEAWLG